MGNRGIKTAVTAFTLAAMLLAGCQRRESTGTDRHPEAAEPAVEQTQHVDTATAEASTVRPPDMRVRVLKGQSLRMETDGLVLTAAGEAVRHGGVYSVTSLHGEELPPLPQGMVNVTSAAAGYRLLPGGDHFSPAAELRVAYDPARLPRGYTPDDIHTSYFDSAAMAWVRLERVGVDTARCEVVSLTTHFTDFVNEVLKAPEMPETQAFVPTAMSDLEAANPMEGATLMQPPAANSHGTAEVSYPLTLPPGRGGMQPNLVLTYSSGGGSGWLGEGWDIPIPSITVETRWGVPRYDRDYESEAYLYSGEQLVMKYAEDDYRPLPHRTRDWDKRVQHDVQFVPRVNESFDSIVRHGATPYDYWWEVYERSGVVHRYGHYTSYSDHESIHPATLRDDLGNIAKWCLTESEDVHGNMVRYLYDTVHDAGIEGGTVKGRQIYPAEIRYTLYRDDNTDTGYFRVVFWREDNDRGRRHSRRFQSMSDCTNQATLEGHRIPATISGRYGFKEVTASLLSHIIVKCGERDSAVRSYIFAMRCDSTTDYRMRLVGIEDNAVKDYDYYNSPHIDYSDKGVLYRGCGNDGDIEFRVLFDYYDAPQERFGHEVELRNIWSDHTGTEFPYGGDVHSLTMSYEPIGALAGNLTTTALGSTMGYGWDAGGGLSVGLGFTCFWTEATVGGTFNGGRSHDEGFLTLIDIDGDGLPDKVFRNNAGQTCYRRHIPLSDGTFFYGVSHPVSGVGNFLSGTSNSSSIGIQLSLGVSATGTRNKNESYTTDYFADVNADGLPDLVTDGGVLFNDISGGHPVFSLPPRHSDPTVADTIRTSTMPCGYVVWDGALNDSLYCEYTVERKTISIQPSYVVPEIMSIRNNVFLNMGYTGVHLEGNSMVGYRYFWNCSGRGSDTADLGGNPEAVRVWVAPYAGTVIIRDTIRMLDDGTGSLQRSRYADGVRHSVQWNRGVTAVDNNRLTCTDSLLLPALTGLLEANDMRVHASDTTITVAQGDLLLFRLQSRGNHNLDHVDWRHHIAYTGNTVSTDNDTYGRPGNEYHSSKDFVVCGDSRFQAPDDGTVSLDIGVATGQLLHGNQPTNIILEVSFHGGATEQYTVTPNSTTYTIHVDHNNTTTFPVQRGDTMSVTLIARNGGTTWGNVECKPRYKFTPESSSDITTPLEYHIPPRIVMDEPWSAPAACRRLFGPLYRGWGRFTYRAEGTDPLALIPLCSLRYDLATFSAGDTTAMKQAGNNLDLDGFNFYELTRTINNTGNYNPLTTTSSRWRRMEPDSRRQLWLGYGNSTVFGRQMVSNTIPQDHFASGAAVNIMDLDCPATAATLQNPKVRTHAKETESVTWNLNGSLLGQYGTARSWSTTVVKSDYLDLNGDRYPDLVSDKSVQYTLPHGGLERKLAVPFKIFSESGGGSISTNVSPGDMELKGKPMFSKVERSSKNEVMPVHPQLSGNGVQSRDTAHINYADINGDGLPDRVHTDGTVELNIGYRFLPAESWQCGGMHRGVSNSLSVSCNIGEDAADPPFNLAKFSIGGGVAMGISDNRTDFQLMDVNGDGLPDKVWREASIVYVRYNLGNGKWSYRKTLFSGDISHGTSFNENIDVSVTGGTTVGFAKVTATVNGTPISRNFSGARAEIMDVDGDGLPDCVTSTLESNMTVRFNQTGKCGLLRQVRNVDRGSFSLDYAYVTPTYESPQGQWVMSECHVVDGHGGPDGYSTFSYRNPRYDRFERTSLGFDTVITVQHLKDNNQDFTPYRQITEGYRNGSYLLRGKKRSESVSDMQGHRYEETLYDVSLVDMENGSVTGDADCPRVAYPQVEKTIVNHYEGYSTPRQTTARSMQYDDHRNVVLYINWGDTNYTGDELRMEMSYLRGQPRNMVSLRDSVVVRGGRLASSPLMRRSGFSYNGQGRLTRRRDYSGATEFSATDYTYDSYGNTASVTLPSNATGQQMEYTYTYDARVHTYPVHISDAYNRHSYAGYNIRHGKPLWIRDASGYVMRYKVDTLGRTVAVTAPDEIDLNAPYTWEAEYRLPLVAVTRHYDPQHPNDPVETVTFCDGWGRIHQVKKDASVEGVPMLTVSGKTDLDALGRAVAQYDPVAEAPGTELTLNTTNSTDLRTETVYDILDRAVSCTTHHDNTILVSTLAVDYVTSSGRSLMRTVATDPNHHSTTALADAYGRTLSSTDPNGGTTLFDYDALGQLSESTDPEGFATSYTYDLLGRLTRRDHPDAGTTQYAYDPAGNVTEMTNATGETVEFVYQFNRLTEKHYPRLPQNDVQYTYNSSNGHLDEIQDGSGQQELSYDKMGRVSKIYRTFAVPNAHNTYTFTMEFRYDSWNRMLTMTYPDGEQVEYTYDCGGQLQSMEGHKGQTVYSYIDDIQYDLFGSRTRIDYGNGTFSRYTYDDLRRLVNLKSYAMVGNNPVRMQDIDYDFDGVGNIENVENRALAIGTLGGVYENSYTYDVLDRLSSSSQSYGTGNGLYMAYSASGRLCNKTQDFTGQRLYYGYDDDNKPHAPRRIYNTTDYTLHDLQWDPNGNLAQVNRYGNTIEYDASRYLFWTEDNRLTNVVDERYYSYYAYDHAGERTLKLTGANTVLDVNADFVLCQSLLKDATLYTSPYLVAGNHGYTKHYYAGTERVCARIGGGGLNHNGDFLGDNTLLMATAEDLLEECNEVMRERVLGSNNPEKVSYPCGITPDEMLMDLDEVPTAVKATLTVDVTDFEEAMADNAPVDNSHEDGYFYHSDHLGSASWITGNDGAPVQHLQYLPFGEPFVNQRTTNYNERFTFTGKEKDPETGFSYFGARYLEHELMSVWLSVDPMSDKYPCISPYAYCAWNPVKLVDPEGKDMWKPEILYDGTVNYVAEKGDNAETLQKQYGLSKTEATALFKTKSSDGRISGKNVASITKTHSEILKYDINYTSKDKMKDIQRRVYHVGFACLYNKAKQNGRPFKLNEFFSGLLPNYSGIVSRDGWGNTPKNLSVPALGGGEIPIRHLSCQSGGDVLIHQDGSHKQTADYTGFILLYTQMARTRTNYEMHAITITYPNESEDLIIRSYKYP